MMVMLHYPSGFPYKKYLSPAVLFPSCFDANAALFEAILGPDDAGLLVSLQFDRAT